MEEIKFRASPGASGPAASEGRRRQDGREGELAIFPLASSSFVETFGTLA
jgi:hypothetical protein